MFWMHPAMRFRIFLYLLLLHHWWCSSLVHFKSSQDKACFVKAETVVYVCELGSFFFQVNGFYEHLIRSITEPATIVWACRLKKISRPIFARFILCFAHFNLSSDVTCMIDSKKARKLLDTVGVKVLCWTLLCSCWIAFRLKAHLRVSIFLGQFSCHRRDAHIYLHLSSYLCCFYAVCFYYIACILCAVLSRTLGHNFLVHPAFKAFAQSCNVDYSW